ncbi:hypothetical protein CDO52_14110 [Nocardiopsis gilva YIM 90087]|uniref:Uncharacterized protein n=1 Tax=Nocardiopsis gilva YIM 90087 TaxID=1235441 RepID=A0A223S6M1_9ACTN|nr:hypothetical protein [Nocardiopsis gilva]ASU83765.1 hypothetical protein CDO52_14110 [Nocardiopsis gilva YIM 90087]
MGLTGPKVDEDARRRHSEDEQAAERLPELLDGVAAAEQALITAQENGVSAEELHRFGMDLDSALTDAMRAAYAKERALIGPRGYVDRIYRRKRLAKRDVRHATEVAERLLTERETHRLHGIAGVPRTPAGV